MFSFILGCMMIAFVVVVGLFFLRLALVLVVMFISAVFALIGWAVEKASGK